MSIEDKSFMPERPNLRLRQQEREYLLKDFRKFVEDNNPPVMDDLKKRMKTIISLGYANIPDLLNIVNAKISPYRVINPNEGKIVVTTDPVNELILERIDKDLLSPSNTQNKKISLELKGLYLSLVTDRKRIHVKKFKSVSTNGYRCLKVLMASPNKPIPVSELGLNGTTTLKDIPKLLGMEGILRAKFISYDSKDKTLFLYKSIHTDSTDAQNIIEYVNANFREFGEKKTD